MKHRGCGGFKENGERCNSPRLRDGDYCLMHSSEYAAEVAEARRLGGLRRRREATLSGAYDIGGLDTIADVRRLLQIAAIDTLALDNSIARSRTLAYLAMAALKTLEVGEIEQRIEALEAVVHGRRALPEPVFDTELEDTPLGEVA